MKIPDNEMERYAFYNDIANACLESRNDRISMYERLRSYFLFGCSTDNDPATFNKILPQIDLLVSFLFAAETTRFGIVVGESEEAQREIKKVPALTRHLNSRWQDSNADVQYGQAVTWSLVFNSMFLKLIQRDRQTIPYLVDPHSFGVLREDMPFLDDQDAFVHVYTISYKVLDRILAAHPQRATIMGTVSAAIRTETRDIPAGVQRIIMSTFPMTSGPNGPGQITSPYNLIDAYRARVSDDRVEMRELWVWDDDKNDYRIATIASGGICVYDRENFFLAGEHPFVQVCPNPAYDYFWGHSEVDRLTQLQDFRETRLEQIAELLTRQVKPPATLRGNWQGIPEESQYAMQVFGAAINTTDPTADAKLWAPTVPPDTWVEMREIDGMFNEMMGLSNVVQGKGDSGVRSKGHAAELARLGSSRIRKRAFTLEDGLEKIGTLNLKLMQQHDPTRMLDEDRKPFIAEQFTKDAVVKVDAHSSSPIFTEDQKRMAFELLEARSIDREELLEMVDPPNKQVLQKKLKQIVAAEQKAQQEEKAAEMASKLKVAK